MAIILVVHCLLWWIYYQPSPKALAGDEETYLAAATRIAAGQPSGLDLLWPPLYPYFVALWLSLSGSLWVVQVVQTLMLFAVAWLLRDLWIRFEGDSEKYSPPADVLALMILTYPPLVAYTHWLWPEILHLTLFVAALWILATRRCHPAWLATLGLLLGLALLTKNLLAPFVPVLLLPLLAEGRWTARIGRVALVVTVLIVTIAPTILTNYSRHGVPVIADSSRFNLWIGLNDQSRRNLVDPIVIREQRIYRDSAETFAERNEILETKIRKLVDERGWLGVLRDQLSRQYFRLFDKDSFFTDQLPGGAFTLRDRGYLDAPRGLAMTLRGWSYGMYAAILVAAAFGMASVFPKTKPWALFALTFLAYNLALFLLLHVKARYRIQFMPFMMVFTCLALDRWLWKTDAPPLGIGAKVAGIVGAALLLFLAFGG